MITLDATVGGASSNSYSTLTEANDYHEGRLHNDDWDEAPPETKTKALIWATKLIDMYMSFNGAVVYSDQALSWPRIGITDRNGIAILSDVIPADIKDATAELAYHLLDSDRTTDPDSAGLSSLRIDVIEMKFDQTTTKEPFPPVVLGYLKPYGEFSSTISSPSIVNLIRT